MHQKSHGARGPHAAASRHQTDQTAWSYSDFFDALYSHALLRRAPMRVADTIDLAPMAPVLSRLRSLAHDRLEHGRVGFVNLASRVLSFEQTQVGTTNRIVIEYVTSATKRPAIMLHTHPIEAGTARAVEHFSEVDLLTFVQNPHLLASVVVTPRYSLMLVKTHLTEHVPEQSRERRIAELSGYASTLSRSSGDAARIATKLAAIEFAMSLFRIDPTEPNLRAHKVILGAG